MTEEWGIEALEVPCAACGAEVGERCRNGDGWHAIRIQLAREPEETLRFLRQLVRLGEFILELRENPND